MKMIIINKIKCKKCGDIIESVHHHDFKICKCQSVAVMVDITILENVKI